MESIIKLSHLSKRYRIGKFQKNIRAILRGMKSNQQQKYHWALKDLSFELEKGDALGIIGPNGAGKTTVLKLLSKVTYPTTGEIHVNGRFSSLIELGAGFHPDLTGRENIYLNGVILGLRKAEIDERFDQIVDFAGIGSYLDTPVKRYSSGMYARLGFSVAAHVNPEILLVDEVLAVGDMAFRKKCYQRMSDMIKNGTSLIFVSHDFNAVQSVCTRCLVLYRGDLVFDGSPAEATAEYSNILRRSATSIAESDIPESGALSQMVMTHKAVIDEVKIIDKDGKPSTSFQSGDNVRVQMHVHFKEHASSPIFACTLWQTDGRLVYDYNNHWAKQVTPDFEAHTQAIIEFALQLNLTGGTYSLGVDLAYSDLSSYYDRIYRALDFVVSGMDGAKGIADLKANFNVLEVNELIDQSITLQ